MRVNQDLYYVKERWGELGGPDGEYLPDDIKTRVLSNVFMTFTVSFLTAIGTYDEHRGDGSRTR